MGWFSRACRHAGLLIHHTLQPIREHRDREKGRSIEVTRRTEEQRVNDRVTLRRTTVEEVEFRRGESADETTDEPRD